MKTVIYDAKRAFFNRTGLGNYSRTILENLKAFAHEEKIEFQALLATHSLKNHCWHEFEQFFSQADVLLPSSPLFQGKLSSLWRSYFIGREKSLQEGQFFHGLSNEIPLSLPKHLKTIITIHDVIFHLYPQLYQPFDRYNYSRKTSYGVNNSNKILCITKQTANDLIKHFQADPKKIEIIYQTCHPQFFNPCSLEQKISIKNIYNLPENFILCVGTVEKRKNQLVILKAIKESKLDIPVVIIGKRTNYCDEINCYIEENKMNNVSVIHDYEFSHFPAIYQSASLFIYPSFYEGFGIPIIEALISGTPVLASNSSCLQEAGGPNSVYFNPNNSSELGSKIKQILDNKKVADEMVENGRKSFKEKFEPKILSEQLIQLYDSL